MFSSITIASSTTKPTASVSAMSDRLSMLKSSTYITENVPMIDIGSVRLGISVATVLRRNRKITATTSTSATMSENFTSRTERWIPSERSYWMCTFSDAGSPRSISASTARHPARRRRPCWCPGCRVIMRFTVRSGVPPAAYHDAFLLFWMSSSTLRNVAEPHRRAVLVRDDQSAELGGVRHLARRRHRERPVAAVEHAGREHDVVQARSGWRPATR